MGLQKEWKKYFKEKFKECFSPNVPCVPDTYVVDVGLKKYNLVHQAFSGQQIKDRIFKELSDIFMNGTKRYYALFDSKAPKNKSALQGERRKNKKFYTEEELRSLFNILPISDGAIPNDSEKIIYTPLLCEDLFRYLTETLLNVSTETIANYISEKGGILNKEDALIRMNDCSVTVYDGRAKNLEWFKDPSIKNIESCLPPLTVCHARKWLNPLSKVKELDYWAINEAELKIVRVIDEVIKDQGKVILIKCCDGDIIPILLMSLRDFIDFKDGDCIKIKIFVDLTPQRESNDVINGFKDPGNILDVVALWRALNNHFFTRGINLPAIETMCALMTLGSDYVESLANIGTNTLLDYFFTHGYKIVTSDNEGLFSYCGEHELIEQTAPRRIVFAEHKWLMLFAAIYTQKLEGNSYANGCYSWEKIEKLITDKITFAAGKQKNTIWTGKRVTAAYHHSLIRRMFWLLDYWTNGARGLFRDPCAKDLQTGLSINGWDEDPNTRRCFATENILIITR